MEKQIPCELQFIFIHPKDSVRGDRQQPSGCGS
jgi:hypothetical protein